MKKLIKPEEKRFEFLVLPLSHKRQILGLSVMELLSSAFVLVGPYLSTLFIDRSFLTKDLGNFLRFSAWGAAIFIVSLVFHAFEELVKNRIKLKVKFATATRLLKKLFSLDFSFFQAHPVGEDLWRIADLETASDFVTEDCPAAIAGCIKLLVILGLCLWLNLSMTLVLLLLCPLFIIQSVYLQARLRPLYEDIWQSNARIYRVLHDAFSKILVIKVFGTERLQRHAYVRALIQSIRLQVKNFFWSLAGSLGSSFLSKAVYGAVTLYGGWLVIQGKLSLGSFTAVMLYLTQFGSTLQSLGYRFESFGRQAASLKEYNRIMDEVPAVVDAPGAKALAGLGGEIRFEKVSFGYEKDRLVFESLDLTLPLNQWIAVVGPSGCGKTTLINLILRLYDTHKGTVLLNGRDIKEATLASLRRRFAVAGQQPMLFDVSVAENITFGEKRFSKQQIEEAAVVACLRDFIVTLPEGFDTVIGEEGARLSQGLKQRLSLARAIIRDSDVLVLDEATSSVDSLTEERIFLALRRMRRAKSTLVVSHRLSSVKDADRIFFLQGLSRVESGTHEELLARSPEYREFFRRQLGQEDGQQAPVR